MKITLLTLITLFCLSSLAKGSKNQYRDFSKHTSDEKIMKLTRSEIMDRLAIKGIVYVTSADGTQLLHDVKETRTWSLNGKKSFESTWVSESDHFGIIALKQKWFFNNKNQLTAKIDKHRGVSSSKLTEPPKIGKKVSTQEFLISNFLPITIDIAKNGSKKTVVQFTPALKPKDEKSDLIGSFPVRAQDMVAFDSKGKIWAESVTFSGKFVSLKTHQGTVHMSYFPFKGSKLIGVAENGKIKVNLNKKHRLYLVSSLPFLPTGMRSNVYGVTNLNLKTEKLRSVSISSTDKENELDI